MAVSKRLRYEILRRDNHTCRYCGASAPDVPLRVDHVTPVALGGTDTADNLATSCEPCNSGKSSASPDAHHVAAVSDDALRWADAMKRAAEDLRQQHAPKIAYRDAFKKSWSSWTREHGWKTAQVDLPDGWKGSLDAFHEAGLPQEIWPDIIEKAMTNPTVRADNTFRYACGIAWRMVRELQERAARIARGQSAPQEEEGVDAVAQAAIQVWIDNLEDEADAEARAALVASVSDAREQGMEPARIIEGARIAAWSGDSDIVATLKDCDRDDALHQWTTAWLTKTGDWPDKERTERAVKLIDKLSGAGVTSRRINRAASYAGAHRSTLFYFGLDDEELAAIGVSGYLAQAIEAWSQAFYASSERWPTVEERTAFLDAMKRIGNDGGIWISEVYTAAAAAGTYQDPDLSTCLTRHLSVFEIAARPLAPAA
ncbi:HNH endonuclease [Streptomyces sp. NPDC004532]